jgi:hypothetical protein
LGTDPAGSGFPTLTNTETEKNVNRNWGYSTLKKNFSFRISPPIRIYPQIRSVRHTPTKATPLSPPRNVVAALDSDSGRLIWRHKFEEEDAVGRILDLAAAGKYVVSASGSANIFLRLWEPTKGVLVQVG